jgi:hypothetical protein
MEDMGTEKVLTVGMSVEGILTEGMGVEWIVTERIRADAMGKAVMSAVGKNREGMMYIEGMATEQMATEEMATEEVNILTLSGGAIELVTEALLCSGATYLHSRQRFLVTELRAERWGSVGSQTIRIAPSPHLSFPGLGSREVAKQAPLLFTFAFMACAKAYTWRFVSCAYLTNLQTTSFLTTV